MIHAGLFRTACIHIPASSESVLNNRRHHTCPATAWAFHVFSFARDLGVAVRTAFCKRRFFEPPGPRNLLRAQRHRPNRHERAHEAFLKGGQRYASGCIIGIRISVALTNVMG